MGGGVGAIKMWWEVSPEGGGGVPGGGGGEFSR